jgi:HK97 family phage major capsid protein
MLVLKELREKQARLVTQARALLADIKPDTTAERAAELEAQHDAAMAEYDQLEERAVKLEKLIKAERAMETGDDRRPRGEDRSSDQDPDRDRQQSRSEDEVRSAFTQLIRLGVAELAPEQRALLSQIRANLTPEMRAQSIGTTTAGGFLVPQGFLPELTKTMALWGPMLDESVIRMLTTDSGNPLPWPTVNDTANTGEDHAENVAAADQDVVFGQKQLGAYVFDSGIVKVSLELLADSGFDVPALLNELFGERLARRANTKLTTGAGGGAAPSGIVTGSTLGKTAASATVIAADEIIDLFHSVDPAYREAPKAAFMMNDTTLAATRKLKDGQGNYLWSMGDVRAGTPQTLLGKPVRVNQAMASIATGNKAMLFGDLGKYIVRKVKDNTLLQLRERFAEALQVGFIAYNRLDGLLSDPAAVKHYKLA